MLIVNAKTTFAINFDKLDAMYVDNNKLVMRHNGEFVSEFKYDTDDDAKIVFNEILDAFATDKKIFNINPKR